MARCSTETFVLSGVVLAGLCYFFYIPLPPHLGNKWQFQVFSAKLKASLIYAEIRYRLGLSDRMAAFRNAFDEVLYVPLTEEDKAALEIYDSQLNGVSARVYKPKSDKGPLPGLVFYHGGGWVVLNVRSYDGVCAHIAREANIIVISVEISGRKYYNEAVIPNLNAMALEYRQKKHITIPALERYRLAPEFPFPAGFNDCVQVARYALQNGGDIGIDPKRIAVGGDSAGGNLAAAVSMNLRDNKVKPALKAQLVIYGVLQMCDLTLPSYRRRELYGNNDRKMLSWFIRLYLNLTETQETVLGGKFLSPEMQVKCDKFVDYKLLPGDLMEDHDRINRQTAETNDVKHINSFLDDPRAFPLMVENLANLPPSFVLVSDWDALRDENLIYAERLKLAGNKVKTLYLKDSFHGILNAFDYERSGFDAGPKAMNEILSFIKKELA